MSNYRLIVLQLGEGEKNTLDDVIPLQKSRIIPISISASSRKDSEVMIKRVVLSRMAKILGSEKKL